MRLQTRLALLFGTVVTVAAVAMGALSFAAISERLSAQVDESLLEVSTPLADDLAGGRGPADAVEGGGRGRHGTSELVLPTQVVLPDGRVVVGDAQGVVLPVDQQDISIAQSAQAQVRLRDVLVDSRPYRMVTQSDGGGRGAIQVGRDVSENAEVLASLAVLLALIGIVVAGLAALAGWLLARRSAARLVGLAEAAERVSTTGQLDTTVPTAGTDEIAQLGSAFNVMLARLARARDDQQRLVQDAGHELRTPLTSLRTNVGLLRHFDDLPADVRDRVIADLDGETRELTHLVNEVLDLAGPDPADPQDEAVPLADVARSVAARALRRTGRVVTLEVDDSIVVGQPAALERAMWNLVENACKFSAPETPVELVVHSGTVLVRDRGPGVDPGDLPHLFDRFYRATSARSLPGSGLGLAIVRDVAEGLGGGVIAANRPAGGGAEIGFRVPAQAQPTGFSPARPSGRSPR